MNKVFIVHGFKGFPNGSWRSWLMSELAKQNVYACALSMPNPSKPLLSEWVGEITRHLDANREDSIYFVGHSLGVPAILRFLEKTKAKNINGIILVSGPIFQTAKIEDVHFLEKPFDYEAIKSKTNKVVVIHSDNDRSVPFKQGKVLAEKLNAELITIKNGGHLNTSSDCYELPECLDALNIMINPNASH